MVVFAFMNRTIYSISKSVNNNHGIEATVLDIFFAYDETNTGVKSLKD